MSRALMTLAAVLAGLIPVLAAETPSQKGSEPTAQSKIAFTMQDARKHLMHLGYTNVSELSLDPSGKWVGSAVKDGKTVPVAVFVKPTH
jgi:hypothetical protein